MSSKHVNLHRGEHYLNALLCHSPVTATRMGVLAMVHDALVAGGRASTAEQFAEAARPLACALRVTDVYEVDAALRALKGRPPAAVARALTDSQLIDMLCTSLDSLGCMQLSDRVARWGPRDPGDPLEALPLVGDAYAQRHELMQTLQARTQELLDTWRREGMQVSAQAASIDGRSILAAARAWQVPMINGTIPAIPASASALHPNRLGRTAVVVAYSNLSAAVRSTAPDTPIFEALALLVAVGESITPPTYAGEREGLVVFDNTSVLARARRGELSVRVRLGEPIEAESCNVDYWWPVFSAWGATSKKLAERYPTAWKLSEAEADVVVWALCNVAVTLAIAGAMPGRQSELKTLGPSSASVDWRQHRVEWLPKWAAGVQSVWGLMQRARRFEDRTGCPVALMPPLESPELWPWSTPPVDAQMVG